MTEKEGDYVENKILNHETFMFILVWFQSLSYIYI